MPCPDGAAINGPSSASYEGPIVSTSFSAVAAATSDERFARMRAETALFMRDHVLSIVSHDLRSPLNAIHSWAYVLERKLDPNDAAAQRALAGIRSGVDQQVKLLEEAVDSTRAETKALPLTRAPFAMRQALDRSLDDVRRALADARGVTIKLDSQLDAEQCDGDRERLSQAIWVMLAFAVEASAPGGSVALASSVESGSWRVDVAYTTSFAALSDAELPHAFDAFSRKQAMLAREAGRIAWVLALPQRVASAHGGMFEQGDTLDGQPSALSLRVPLVAV
ncbi:sensor histidine kinase [Trinickia sp. EG282A]|uniref:sensor histidine kinase n=1 Tax=Trinickia sp. EG282A TaxID=3237013 RepID=UPI0034D32FB0